MSRLKDKFLSPKAQSFHEGGSLHTIVRDSIYLAWPIANLSEDKEPKRKLHRQAEVIDEEDECCGE